jgi:cytoplasmic iron level regulating protein YaaA (DUF328/UPF0246 family)
MAAGLDELQKQAIDRAQNRAKYCSRLFGELRPYRKVFG